MFVDQEKHLGDFLEEIFKGFVCGEEKANNWMFNNFNITSQETDDMNYIREAELSNYGIIDFQLKVNKTLYLLELKKGKIGLAELGQIFRYITGAKKLYGDDLNIIPILMGGSFDNSDACFIYNELINLTIYFYDFDYVDGLTIKEQDKRWVLK